MTESKCQPFEPTPGPRHHAWSDSWVEAAIASRTPGAARLWLTDAHTKGMVTDDQWRRYEGRCNPDER